MNWNVQPLSRNRIGDIESLYYAAYEWKAPKDHFLRKYATGYTGIEYAGYMAYLPNGKPVALLGLIPCFISYEGKRILAAQLVDSVTHPDYRKQGLAGLLEDHIVAFAKEKGIKILFGFPNEKAYPVWLRKGWVKTDELYRFWVFADRSWDWFISLVLQWDNKAPSIAQADCANSVFADGFAGIERSREYLAYKSFTNTRVISTESGRAWVKGGHHFAIGDMDVDKEGFDKLLKRVRAKASRTLLKRIMFQCSKDTTMYRLFAERYKGDPSYPVVMKTFDPDIDVNKIKFTFADIDIF